MIDEDSRYGVLRCSPACCCCCCCCCGGGGGCRGRAATGRRTVLTQCWGWEAVGVGGGGEEETLYIITGTILIPHPIPLLQGWWWTTLWKQHIHNGALVSVPGHYQYSIIIIINSSSHTTILPSIFFISTLLPPFWIYLFFKISFYN